MTEEAAKYEITDFEINRTEEGVPVTATLMGVSVTESGKVVVEFLLNAKMKCATYDVELTGDVYVIKDSNNKVVGKFSMAKPVAMASPPERIASLLEQFRPTRRRSRHLISQSVHPMLSAALPA